MLIDPNLQGISAYLRYDRRPSVGRCYVQHLRPPALSLPRRYYLRCDEVARLGLYSMRYRLATPVPHRFLYWVRVWTHEGRGYTLLITPNEAAAAALASNIVAAARLQEWAVIHERGVEVNASAPPLDEATIANWKIDRRLMSCGRGKAAARLRLWRAR